MPILRGCRSCSFSISNDGIRLTVVRATHNSGFKRVVAGNAFPNVPNPVFIDELRIIGSNKRLAAFAAFDDGGAGCRRMHGLNPCVLWQ